MHLFHGITPDVQIDSDRSFVGGRPTLPTEISWPMDTETQENLVFFFQIKLPSWHSYAGKIVSVFSNPNAYEDDRLIPKLPQNLKGAQLDRGFFRGYQSFFRVILLEDENLCLRDSDVEYLQFFRLEIGEANSADRLFGEISDQPNWLLEDEAPHSFEGRINNMKFLFQTKIDYRFLKKTNSPAQRVSNYETNIGFSEKKSNYYDLFASNEIYYYLIKNVEEYIFYIIPQS